jgi:hypothetical protein
LLPGAARLRLTSATTRAMRSAWRRAEGIAVDRVVRLHVDAHCHALPCVPCLRLAQCLVCTVRSRWKRASHDTRTLWHVLHASPIRFIGLATRQRGQLTIMPTSQKYL